MDRATLVLALVGVLGCRAEATQLIVVVDSDIADVTRVELIVTPVDGSAPAVTNTVDVGGGLRTLPFSFGVAPSKGMDPEEQTVRIRAVAYTGAMELVERRVQVGFVKKKTLHLLMYLAEACRGVACPGTQTCDRGVCVEEFIDARDLPEVSPGDAIGFDAGRTPIDAAFDTLSDTPVDAPEIASPPEPTYPWNGVADRNLELTWTSDAPVGYTHQVQFARECDDDRFTPRCVPEGDGLSVVAVVASGASGSHPMGAEGAGRYYWRVRTCVTADVDCSEWSATRYFDFGRTDMDLRLDGHDDLVIGAPGADVVADNDAGRIYVYEALPDMGSPVEIEGRVAGDQFGRRVAFAGDVDGNGRPDLLIGGLARFEARSVIPELSFSQAAAPGLRALAGIGDVDSDGFADFAVSNGLNVTIYFGAVTPGIAATIDVANVESVAGVGDLDGDGLADFALGIPNDDEVQIYAGSRSRMFPLRGSVSGTPADREFGATVIGIGDEDDDGLPDLLIGSPDRTSGGLEGGRAVIVSGRDTMGDISRTVDVVYVAPDSQHFGTAAAPLFPGYVVAGSGNDMLPEQMGEVVRFDTDITTISFGQGDFGAHLSTGDFFADGVHDVAIGATNGGAAGEVTVSPDATNQSDEFLVIPLPGVDPGFGVSAQFSVLAQAPLSRLR